MVQKAPKQVTPCPVAVVDAKKTAEAIKADVDPPNTPKEKDPSSNTSNVVEKQPLFRLQMISSLDLVVVQHLRSVTR
ncbi:unnamed protein product [Caenorhabditis nigoni]